MNIIGYLTSKFGSVSPKSERTCKHGIPKNLLCTHCIEEFTENFHLTGVSEGSAYARAAEQLEAVAAMLREIDDAIINGGTIEFTSGCGDSLGAITFAKTHKN